MSDYDDYDYDSDYGYHFGGPEYSQFYSDNERLYSDDDCLFGERKSKPPSKKVETQESSIVPPPIVEVPPPVVEMDDQNPTPMKSKAEVDGREALEARIEEVKQVLAYFKDKKERDMMSAGPSQQAPKKLHRSFSL